MRIAALVLLVVAVLTACTRSTPAPEATDGAVEAPNASYSPFVLRMSAELPFGRISFKDVGMSLEPEGRALVYEEVAQSLSHALAADPELPMSSEVLYSEAVADPASHLACGVDHIYVDVWAPQGTERWGYSLWSGCSEDDRFALREVDRVGAEDVDALTRDIAAELRRAVTRRCFVKRC